MTQDSESQDTLVAEHKDVAFVEAKEVQLPPGIIESTGPFAETDWLGVAKEFILPAVSEEKEKHVRAAHTCLETIWKLELGKPTNRQLEQYSGLVRVAGVLAIYQPESRKIKDKQWKDLLDKYKKRAKNGEDPVAIANEHRLEMDKVEPTNAERTLAFFAIGLGQDMFEFPAYGVRTTSSLKQEKIPLNEILSTSDAVACELGQAIATLCRRNSLSNSDNPYLRQVGSRQKNYRQKINGQWKDAFQTLPDKLQTTILKAVMGRKLEIYKQEVLTQIDRQDIQTLGYLKDDLQRRVTE